MAPLAAKWGRLWRALLGQARIGHEAQSLPTSLSSACPSRPSSLTGLHQQVSLQHGCLQVSGKSRPGGQLARPSSVSTAEFPRVPPLHSALTGRLPGTQGACSLLATKKLAQVGKDGQGETEAGSQQHMSLMPIQEGNQEAEGAARRKQPVLGPNSGPVHAAAHGALGLAVTQPSTITTVLNLIHVF